MSETDAADRRINSVVTEFPRREPLKPATEVRAGEPALERVVFTRDELQSILNLYGRMVAAGEWRDYAMDFLKDRAVFSVFRRASEVPIYRIEKSPKLASKQGAFSVVAATGLVMRRGSDLGRVLQVLDKSLKVVRS